MSNKKKIFGTVFIILAVLIWTPFGLLIDQLEDGVKTPWSAQFSLLELFSYFVAPVLLISGLFMFVSSTTNPILRKIQDIFIYIVILIGAFIFIALAGYGFSA